MPNAKRAAEMWRLASIDPASVRQSNPLVCFACGKGKTRLQPLVRALLNNQYTRETEREWLCLTCAEKTFKAPLGHMIRARAEYAKRSNERAYPQFFTFIEEFSFCAEHEAIKRALQVHADGKKVSPQIMSRAMKAVAIYSNDAVLRDNLEWLLDHPKRRETLCELTGAHMGDPDWASIVERKAVESMRRVDEQRAKRTRLK